MLSHVPLIIDIGFPESPSYEEHESSRAQAPIPCRFGEIQRSLRRGRKEVFIALVIEAGDAVERNDF